MSANTVSNALGMIPRSAGGSSDPSMVCVLPVPVWPQQKHRAVIPSMAARTMGNAVSS